MIKRLTAILLCLCIGLSLCCCGKKEEETKKTKAQKSSSEKKKDGTSASLTEDEKEYDEKYVTGKFFEGKPSAPGDVYNMPDIEAAADGAPILAEITAQASPDDTVTVVGEGFSASDLKAYVYTQSTKDDGKATQLKCTVTEDQTAAVTIDGSLQYGLYGVYFEADGKKSNVVYVNQPKIWWIGLTKLTAGEELKIFGENLTVDNGDRSYVFLTTQNNTFIRLEVSYADPYKITAKIPDVLEENVAYGVVVHNGHGGDLGFATAEDKVYYSKTQPIQFNGNKIDVTDYGADPADNGGDDTAAVMKAVAAAKNGDTLYFPYGTYLITSMITVEKSLKMQGDGKGKSFLIMGPDVKKGMFFVKKAPMEICDLEVWDVRQRKLTTSFVYFESFENSSDTYNLYVHDCRFYQETTLKYNSNPSVIQVHSSTQVIVEDNDFECTLAIFAYMVEKLYFNNNRYVGTFYHTAAGLNENATLIWATNGFESYGNTFYSKGKSTETVTDLLLKERTVGRLYALQNYNNSVYIAHNRAVNTGVTYDNLGEQIMFETGSTYYDGAPSAVGADSITIPKTLTSKRPTKFTVMIAAGKGMGQYRQASSYSGNVLYFDDPFTIQPDSTSRILVLYYGSYNAAVYKNYFNCHTNYAEYTSATSGVQAYANNINFFITDNEFSNMTYGIQLSPHFADTSKDNHLNNGLYWMIIQNNKMTDCGSGIRFNLIMGDTTKDYRVGVGVTIRRNEFTDMVKYSSPRERYEGGTGITIGDNGSNGHLGDWIHTTVIEHNTFKNCATYDVYFYKYQNHTILRGNSSSYGTLKTGAESDANKPVNISY